MDYFGGSGFGGQADPNYFNPQDFRRLFGYYSEQYWLSEFLPHDHPDWYSNFNFSGVGGEVIT